MCLNRNQQIKPAKLITIWTLSYIFYDLVYSKSAVILLNFSSDLISNGFRNFKDSLSLCEMAFSLKNT
jgi:hypothetical protein